MGEKFSLQRGRMHLIPQTDKTEPMNRNHAHYYNILHIMGEKFSLQRGMMHLKPQTDKTEPMNRSHAHYYNMSSHYG